MTQDQLLQAPTGRVDYSSITAQRQGFNARNIEANLEALLSADRAARNSEAVQEARQQVNNTIGQNPTWNLPGYIVNPQHAGHLVWMTGRHHMPGTRMLRM